MLKTPFSPLIAQLTDRAGMMVSPKAAKEAGDKFGLNPVCAGPYKFVERVQQDRIVVEKFADYWNKDNVFIDRIVFLPIVDATVRLANLKSGGLDLIERVLATDIKEVRADPSLKLSSALSLGYLGITINIGKRQGRRGRWASPPRCARRSISRSTARRSTRSCSTASSCPATSGSAPSIPTIRRHFRCRSAIVAKAKALLKEAGVTAPVSRRLHGAEGRGERGRRPGHAVDGGRGRLRPEDPRHRVRDLAQAGRGRRIPGLS